MKTKTPNEEEQAALDEIRDRERLDAHDIKSEMTRDEAEDSDPFGWRYDSVRRVAQGNLEDGKRTI